MNKIIKSLILIIMFMFFTGNVNASTMSVRLSEPNSPTNINNFSLTFVVLDSASGDVVVKCYKKGPKDSLFSQFGSDFNFVKGGNTGNCPVDSSVVHDPGTYRFYVEAIGSLTTNSQIVSVDYNISSNPGNPTNYSKEKTSECNYKIKFKTADDSMKTVKVELYRSESKSFTADSGTRVGVTDISSNTEGEFSNTVGECNKNYYFAIRAFDVYGNGSGIIGDSEVNVVFTSETILQANPNPTEQPILAESSNIPQGENVLGVRKVNAENNKDVLGEQAKSSGLTPEVIYLAPATFIQENILISIVIAAFVLGIIIYVYFRNKRKSFSS